MAFTSATFLLFVFAVVSAYLCWSQRAYRTAVLSIANVVFLCSFATAPLQLVPLLGFVLLGFVMARCCQRWAGHGTRLVPSCLFGLLAVYSYLKQFSFVEGLPAWPFAYTRVGLSYILFRIIHLMLDAHAGALARPVSLLGYFNYTCGFLSFVSGPIQRYQDFLSDLQATGARERREDPESRAVMLGAFSRIVTGYFKLVVISAIANYVFLHTSDTVLGLDWNRLAHGPLGNKATDTVGFARYVVFYCASAASYTVYLYYNFSGYMDIVIGVGRLLSMQVPENFRTPFEAQNFLEFWQRWHMTLSDWFKTYLFNPLLTAMIVRFDSATAAPYLGVLCFFITFLVMGVWHGTTLVFVVYGLIMGAGASGNKLWQLLLTKRLGREAYKRLGESALYRYACRGLTTAYFALGVTCLWVNWVELLVVVRKLGVVGGIASLGLLTLLAAVAYAAVDGALVLVRRTLNTRRDEPSEATPLNFLTTNLGLASQILFIVTVASFFHKAPDFVYRAF